MSFKTMYSKLSITLLLMSSIVCASNNELLHVQDINTIMKQLFDQHVDKKEISLNIIKNSFKVYIDQFDPERTYLLEQEVHPFLQMSDQELTRGMEQYRKGQFVEYADLNLIIQKAIYRAQQLRKDVLKKNVIKIIQTDETHPSNGYEGWSDPDLKQKFATSTLELEKRIKHKFSLFVAIERKRYGNDYLLNHIPQVLDVYDREIRNHENQYLFLNDNGQPMNDAEKQNGIALHILKALASSLDAHTTVMSSLEAADMRIRLEKELLGVGIEIQTQQDGSFMIIGLTPGGSAANNGVIKINDQIVKVDNVTVKDKSIDELLEMLRGKKDTKVMITIKHAGSNIEIPVTLQREKIEMNENRVETSFERVNGGIIGKIKLDAFYQGENNVSSEEDIRNAIEKFKKEGDLRGLILDFRENSGGFLSQAIKVVGLFISNGVVVISQYFNGEKHVYRDMDGKTTYDGPLIILTSKATASAAEIVAQALQDYGVALIVGDEHTYGKGTIQSQTVTENQGSTYFKVTVGKYYTASGKTPQIQGVKADIVVPSQFAHEKLGEEYLDYPLQQDTIPDSFNDNLEDIEPNLKSWYMRYYMPTLQHKLKGVSSLIPKLKKNSEYRIANNKKFQSFLKGTEDEAPVGTDEDLQMIESSNIMKDIITLQQETRFDHKEK